MATLKQGCELVVENLHIGIFEAEEGGSLLEVFLVENETLVLVKEILFEGLSYSFFDLRTQERIDPVTRYELENGKLSRSQFGDFYEVECKINIDSSTGFEWVDEKVIKDNEVVYENTRERYSLKAIEPISKRFMALQRQKETQKENVDKIIDDFLNSKHADKVKLLRSLFRKEWRNGCELGVENPEYFISRDMYNRISKDIDFNDVLLEMLKLEELCVGVCAQELYRSIENYYCGS